MSINDKLTIDLDQSQLLKAKIKVIGVGGGGCNAIQRMAEGKIQGVDLIAANTDAQALATISVDNKIQLGPSLTRGLGAGSNPDVGKDAAKESEQEIRNALKDSELIIVTCGMGGGTGTGAAPIVARIAKELGALVLGIVTRPFDFEAHTRIDQALKGIEEMRKNVDAIIVIPNQKIFDIYSQDIDIKVAFKKIDEVLFNSTRGISDIINLPGIINVDFADVRTIMRDAGEALIGIGRATGEARAKEAALQAINSPLLDGISIEGAKGLLVNITYGKGFTMSEMQTISNTIQEFTGFNVNLIQGIVEAQDETDEVSVTVIATGFLRKSKENRVSTPEVEPMFGYEKSSRVGQINNSYNQRPQMQPRPFPKQPEGFKIEMEKPLTIPKGEELKMYDTPTVTRIANFPDTPMRNNITQTPKQAVSYYEDQNEISLDGKVKGVDIFQLNHLQPHRSLI